jgi:hypothetical protein
MEWWEIKTCYGKGVKKNMMDERREIKIKYANDGRRVENKLWDNYRFILSARASHFRSVSKTVSIPEDLSCWCD